MSRSNRKLLEETHSFHCHFKLAQSLKSKMNEGGVKYFLLIGELSFSHMPGLVTNCGASEPGPWAASASQPVCADRAFSGSSRPWRPQTRPGEPPGPAAEPGTTWHLPLRTATAGGKRARPPPRSPHTRTKPWPGPRSYRQ